MTITTASPTTTTENIMKHSLREYGNSAASPDEVRGEKTQHNARSLENGDKKSSAEFLKKPMNFVRNLFNFSKSSDVPVAVPAATPFAHRELAMTEVEKLKNKQIALELNSGITKAFKNNIQFAICENHSLTLKFLEKIGQSPENAGIKKLDTLNRIFINFYNEALIEKYKEHRSENKPQAKALIHAHKGAFAEAVFQVSSLQNIENSDKYTEVICQFEFGNVEKIMLSGLQDEALTTSLYDEKSLPNRFELTLKTANLAPDAADTSNAPVHAQPDIADANQNSSDAPILSVMTLPEQSEVAAAAAEVLSETPKNMAPASTEQQEFALDKTDENDNVSKQAETSEPAISKEAVIAHDGDDVAKENDLDQGTRLDRTVDDKRSALYWDKRNPEYQEPSKGILDVIFSLGKNMLVKKHPAIEEKPMYKNSAAKEEITAAPALVEKNNDARIPAAISNGARLDDAALESFLSNGMAIEKLIAKSDHAAASETGTPTAIWYDDYQENFRMMATEKDSLEYKGFQTKIGQAWEKAVGICMKFWGDSISGKKITGAVNNLETMYNGQYEYAYEVARLAQEKPAPKARQLAHQSAIAEVKIKFVSEKGLNFPAEKGIYSKAIVSFEEEMNNAPHAAGGKIESVEINANSSRIHNKKSIVDLYGSAELKAVREASARAWNIAELAYPKIFSDKPAAFEYLKGVYLERMADCDADQNFPDKSASGALMTAHESAIAAVRRALKDPRYSDDYMDYSMAVERFVREMKKSKSTLIESEMPLSAALESPDFEANINPLPKPPRTFAYDSDSESDFGYESNSSRNSSVDTASAPKKKSVFRQWWNDVSKKPHASGSKNGKSIRGQVISSPSDFRRL